MEDKKNFKKGYKANLKFLDITFLKFQIEWRLNHIDDLNQAVEFLTKCRDDMKIEIDFITREIIKRA